MRIKIHGGTAKQGDTSLCLTCRYATVIQGPSIQHRIVECGRISSGEARISFPVFSCSAYADRRLPSIREMEEIAWFLRSDPRSNQVGFVHAKRLKLEERHDLSDDEWRL